MYVLRSINAAEITDWPQLRPFLYPPFYQSLAFKCIDRELEKMGAAGMDVD